jgi:hypothetical protein
MPAEENFSNPNPPEIGVNPGYAFGQISTALRTAEEHPDAATRTRARSKIQKWLQTVEGMFSGRLNIGTRTPVKNTPAWATLKVLRGGFASGNLLAEGELLPHEHKLLARLGAEASDSPRATLNHYFLTDAGIAELQTLLQAGTYRITVPEEGVLLTIAWLLSQNDADAARTLLEEIAPFLSRLRFYPVPHSEPLRSSEAIHLQTVADTIADLQAVRMSRRFAAQRESVIWAGMSDRIVTLWLETLAGEVPKLQTGTDGAFVLRANGQPVVEGGWPCQIYPDGWRERAQMLLDEYRRLRKEHPLCHKPDRLRTNFAFLRSCLEICVHDPTRLTARDVGRIRRTLANIVHKRDLPSSERTRRLRDYQNAIAAKPSSAELAKVVIARLAVLPQDDGLDSVDNVLEPVTADEAQAFGVPSELPLYVRFADKVCRSRNSSLNVLIGDGTLASGEMLALVVPQLTVQVTAAQFGESELGRLYGAVYRAFRRRRSLLLLNLASQVKFTELPWVAALETYRQPSSDVQAAALQTLEQVVTAAITAFPQQILPNKLLQELRTLAAEAKQEIPFVDEVAADIFMGAFSEKFLHAAQIAGKLLQGTLYERYYGLPYARVLQISDVKPARLGGTPTSAKFLRVCEELAGVTYGGYSAARNGRIIEQEQLLTTHNLAPLFVALGLTEKLRLRLPHLARACFGWISKQSDQPSAHFHALLRRTKNSAYAWRQMVFFLSLLPQDAQEQFLSWANDHLGTQPERVRAAFAPALQGLADAVHGQTATAVQTSLSVSPERFLGWTTESHWLLN